MAFFMNKKRNKYVFWVLVAMISFGLIGPVSIGYWTNYSTSPQAGTVVSSPGAAKGDGYFEEAMNLQASQDKKAADKFKQAIAEYEAVIKTSPDDPAVLGNLATSYFYTGNTDKAISIVQKALEIDPNFSTARMNYAIYLGNGKGQTQEAIKELQKVKAGDPNYEQAQQLLTSFSTPAPSPLLKKK